MDGRKCIVEAFSCSINILEILFRENKLDLVKQGATEVVGHRRQRDDEGVTIHVIDAEGLATVLLENKCVQQIGTHVGWLEVLILW